ncbi:MAG TPA: hypothetical protein VG106_05555 [Vicinamibacterales bacterium]|nr:hypothetical protein [Vicinamibacterales bacterium]
MRIRLFRLGAALPSTRVVSGLTFAAVAVVATIGVAAQATQTAPPPKPAIEKAQEAPKPAAEKLPAASDLVARHIKAIGGREAVMSHSSSHASGTFGVPAAGLTGTVEVFAAKPNRMLMKITVPGLGEMLEGFDGTHAWSLSPMTGPALHQGKQLEERRFDSEYYGELKSAERYESMTTLEKTTLDGRPVYKVRLVRKGGGEDTEFYDVESGLKAGSVNTRETPMGTITATTIETDYKKFGNILVPTTIKQSGMGVEQVMTINAVEFDTVDAKVFDPPAQIKALIK